MKIKILLIGTEQEPSLVRIEMSSEADLFFHYAHVMDEISYRKIQEQQKLMISFHDYTNVVIRMLNACLREPSTNMSIFLMHGDTDARLDFIQNMEYKFVELLSCVFERTTDEIVQHHITYRYNAIKQKLGIMQVRFQELNALVKTKNPSLLLQLQKSQGNSVFDNINTGSYHGHSNTSNASIGGGASIQQNKLYNIGTSTAWR